MSGSTGLRRSTRIRGVVTSIVASTATAPPTLKRTHEDAFVDTDHATPATTAIVASIHDDGSSDAVKFEAASESVTIKTEVSELNHNDELFRAGLPAYDHDFIPVQSKPKRAKKSKTKLEDLSDGSDSMIEKPRRKPVKKKKTTKDADVPHRLVITKGMVRPPGEKQPPMIYPVIKKPRDPKLPSLLSELVATFSERMKRNQAKIPRLKPGEAEKRLVAYNDEPSYQYNANLDRASTQRLFVLQRERTVEEDCHALHKDCPIEHLMVTGTTGNVYNVTITHKPTCDCGDYIFRKRNCKHILYVLHNVLKVTGDLQYQDAFLTSELKEIARNAPALPEVVAKDDSSNDGKRKAVEDDCPICCMAFEEGEKIVWCQALCGNNVHEQCFNKWAAARPHHVTCPFCRSDWQKDAPQLQAATFSNVTMPLVRNSNGYLNVADQLGYT